MAALQSLDTTAEDCCHYYHCVIHDVPLEMPLSEIAGQVVPQETSEPVRALQAHHCKIVPHRLHMYKEPLARKFGYITFFVHVGPQCTLDPSTIHGHTLKWIAEDLQTQMKHVNAKVCLAQPPECYSSHAFLRFVSETCDIVNPSKVLDSKKMETFVLSKVRFNEEGKNGRANGAAAKQQTGEAEEPTEGSATTQKAEAEASSSDGEGFSWVTVGRFPATSLTGQELVWLKKQVTGFPPLLVTNNDFTNARCDPDKLRAFFESTLTPLFELSE